MAWKSMTSSNRIISRLQNDKKLFGKYLKQPNLKEEDHDETWFGRRLRYMNFLPGTRVLNSHYVRHPVPSTLNAS